jgi:ATP-dependent protease ClpP protease subunit
MNDIGKFPQRPPAELASPQIRLTGPVGDEMLRNFLDGLTQAETGDGALVLEITTTGGDAEVGRRIASDVRLFRERTGRRTLFYGKASVYSAGATVMSAFAPADRWLSRESTVLIHCRSLEKTLTFSGPLKAERIRVEEVLAEIEAGIRIEHQDFERLVEGTGVPLSELLERAEAGWYVSAEEALQRGLVGGVA